jgi:hypothetical protein
VVKIYYIIIKEKMVLRNMRHKNIFWNFLRKIRRMIILVILCNRIVVYFFVNKEEVLKQRKMKRDIDKWLYRY